jgi:hypothetical protein
MFQAFKTFLILLITFIILAYNLVKQGPLIQWDLPLAKSFHAFALNSPSLLTKIMIAGYYIGSGTIWITAIILALYFLLHYDLHLNLRFFY